MRTWQFRFGNCGVTVGWLWHVMGWGVELVWDEIADPSPHGLRYRRTAGFYIIKRPFMYLHHELFELRTRSPVFKSWLWTGRDPELSLRPGWLQVWNH